MPWQITDEDKGPVWLEKRRSGIGGTNAVVLMGHGYYEDETPYFVWAEKCAGYSVPSNLAMKRGHDLEPIVRERYEQESEQRVLETGMWVHKDHPHILGSPDGIVVDDDGNWIGGFEAKTTLSRSATDFDDDCPARFEWQVRHYMMVMDLPWFDVACLIVDTWEMHYWRVERDLEKERRLYATCTEFWDTYVKPRIPPDPEPNMNTMEVKYRYLTPTEKVLDLDLYSPDGQRVAQMVIDRKALKAQEKHVAEELEKIDNGLRAIAGDYEEVALDGVRAYTWKSQKEHRVDVKLLREKYPELAKECAPEKSHRVLRVK